jgi:hypothetical protein
MRIEIRNRMDGRTSAREFMDLRHELVRALADYLIANDLVKIELKKGNLIVSVDVNLRKKNENTD